MPIKHDKSSRDNLRIDPTGHRVSLRWSKDLGWVEFKLGDIDPSNWAWWRRIVEGNLEPHTPKLTLQRRKNKEVMALLVSYEVDPAAAAVVILRLAVR